MCAREKSIIILHIFYELCKQLKNIKMKKWKFQPSKQPNRSPRLHRFGSQLGYNNKKPEYQQLKQNA